MKFIKMYSFVTLISMFILFAGCSKINEHLPQDPELNVHQTGILNSSSANFHGTMLATAGYDYTGNCARCHGADFSGGVEATSCKKCHTETYLHLKDQVYAKALLDKASPFFHGKLISDIESYSMTKCQKCHGTDYKGGKVNVSCVTCHSNTNGPEACNTCHGTPGDVTGMPSSGLHSQHMSAGSLSSGVTCGQCHTAYSTYTQSGHIDKVAGVELNWGSIAKLETNNPANNSTFVSNDPTSAIIKPVPTYNATTGSCANTYCHGNFKYGNTSNIVTWASGSLKCGSCHGDGQDNPLPKKHKSTDTDCARCHFNVTKSGNTHIISDKSKHIDGKVNIFGQDFVF